MTSALGLSTGKSFSESLILAFVNPQYDNRLFIELQVQYEKNTSSEHVVYKKCFFVLVLAQVKESIFDLGFGIQNNVCTQHVLNLYFSCTEVSNQ